MYFLKKAISLLARYTRPPCNETAIYGIDTTQKHIRVPSLTLNLDDLYPSSVTKVRLYKGTQQASPSADSLIELSTPIEHTADPIKPDDKTFSINAIDGDIEEDGTYTLDILHETPCGEEVLEYVTFEVERKIVVRGSIITSE